MTNLVKKAAKTLVAGLECRANKQIRRLLQNRFVEEAAAAPANDPALDTDQLWRRIAGQLPHAHGAIPRVRYARKAMWGVVGLGVLVSAALVLSFWPRSRTSGFSPDGETYSSMPRFLMESERLEREAPLQSLMKVEDPRCNPSRQSCPSPRFL